MKVNSRTLTKAKNKNATVFSPVFGKKLASHTFTLESANEARDVSNPEFGHNFGDVQVESPSFKQSCPLSLSGPAHCPFGGACHTCPPRVQAKLKIGQPGDKCEQEADRVAEQVMRMPESQVQRKGCLSSNDMDEEEQIQAKPITQQITPLVQRQEAEPEEEEEEEPVQAKLLVQRQAEEEEEEEEEVIQTKQDSGQSARVTPGLTTNIQSLHSGGQPLSESTRAYFEPRFGQDFSQVRIHTGAQAAESARAVDAQAFTVGRDVVFGAGEFAPEKVSGRRLLAHELTHVLQQSSISGQPACAAASITEAKSQHNSQSTPRVPSISDHTGLRHGVIQRKRSKRERWEDQRRKRKAATGEETAKLLRAADRARREPDDPVSMLINGAQIVYGLIRMFSPALAEQTSVSFDEKIGKVKVAISSRGGVEVTVGKQFILNTNADTLTERGNEVLGGMGAAMGGWAGKRAGKRAAKMIKTERRATARTKEHELDELDNVAVRGMREIFCQTLATGHEFCGNIIKNVHNDELRLDGPYTSGAAGVCHAPLARQPGEQWVAHYHSHPQGQGLDFSDSYFSGRVAHIDTEHAEDARVDYYLINSEGGMRRYIPSRDVTRRGRKVDLGNAGIRCP